MRVEKTASFAEILGSIHAPEDDYSIGIKRVEADRTPAEQDTIQLSVQGERALGRSKTGKGNAGREFPPVPEYDTQIDQQGNRIRLSSKGAFLAESSAENVAWETGRPPRATDKH